MATLEIAVANSKVNWRAKYLPSKKMLKIINHLYFCTYNRIKKALFRGNNMSRHRKKNKENEGRNNFNMNGRNPMMNNPFGIDPKQLLGMLGGNIDMGRLNNMLSSMNIDGFDFNSFAQMANMNNINSNMNNMASGINSNMNNNFSNSMGYNNNQGINSFDSNNQKDTKEEGVLEEVVEDKERRIESTFNNNIDENIQFLNSIKNIVNPNKIEFIDEIIKAYREGKIENK